MNILRKIPKKYFAIIPSKLYLSLRYYFYYKKFPDIKNGQSFDEKMTKFILYYRHPDIPVISDKYLARDYISKKGYSKYLPTLYGVYDHFDDIDFNKLPDQFVLKANHGCKYNIIVRDKAQLNIAHARIKIEKWMKTNHYYHAREWMYKHIKRKIICEQYLKNKDQETLIDYKFSSFDGQLKVIHCISHLKDLDNYAVTTYDENWQSFDFHYRNYPKDTIEKPKCFDKMKDIAATLSKGFLFIRVDFYVVNDKIYIGELSFFPNAGLATRIPEKYDNIFGSWMQI